MLSCDFVSFHFIYALYMPGYVCISIIDANFLLFYIYSLHFFFSFQFYINFFFKSYKWENGKKNGSTSCMCMIMSEVCKRFSYFSCFSFILQQLALFTGTNSNSIYNTYTYMFILRFFFLLLNVISYTYVKMCGYVCVCVCVEIQCIV